MNTLCELVLALGFTLGGACDDPAANGMPLPSEDRSAWEFRATPPPQPEPKAVVVAKAPSFPPVVIEKTILVQAPLPAVQPEPKIVYRDPPTPDPVELALQAMLGNRNRAYGPLAQKAVLSVQEDQSEIETAGRPDLPVMESSARDEAPGLLDAPPSDAKYQHEKRTSSEPVNNERIVTADRYIPGILETGINSQLDSEDGGTAIIQTSANVYGYHGRNILIPKGSRMICDYGSPKKQGSTRIALECGRILMGETRAEIYQLEARAGNQQGHAGITGTVDNRWWEKYGSAILLSSISAAVQGVASIASNSGGGEGGNNNASAAQESAAQLSERFGEISASVLEQTVNLAPVIRIVQGTRVQIRPKFDWYIPEPT